MQLLQLLHLLLIFLNKPISQWVSEVPKTFRTDNSNESCFIIKIYSSKGLNFNLSFNFEEKVDCQFAGKMSISKFYCDICMYVYIYTALNIALL